MALRLTQDDFKLLAAVAEYRVLTTGQAVEILSRNERALRARLNELAKGGYLQVGRTIATRRGRPETQTGLTEAGIDLLKERGLLPEKVPAGAVVPGPLAGSAHHQALNDFRAHLAALPKSLSALAVKFLTDKSPTLRDTPAGQVFAEDWLDGKWADKESPRSIPDGVFMIKHELRNTALLFVLEIDMETESLTSETRPRGDIRHKIRDYQAWFRTERYKRYEGAWGCRFNGFRCLFVTSTANHRKSICRTVAANPPSAFVWVTDQDRLAAQGLPALIWSRGGRATEAETSILGPEVSREILERAGRAEPAVEG